jgi:hypothetical protein
VTRAPKLARNPSQWDSIGKRNVGDPSRVGWSSE